MNRLLFDGFDNLGCKLPRFMVVELTQCDSEESVAKVIMLRFMMKLCFDMQQIVNEIKTEFNTRAETGSF
jgi:hypothetical protein